MSIVISPPVGPNVSGSARVRSGLIRSQLWPSSVVRHTCCEVVYITRSSSGENTIGNVHCQRSGKALAGSPEKKRGYTWMSRIWPVRRL